MQVLRHHIEIMQNRQPGITLLAHHDVFIKYIQVMHAGVLGCLADKPARIEHTQWQSVHYICQFDQAVTDDKLLQKAQAVIVIYTEYFNWPGSIGAQGFDIVELLVTIDLKLRDIDTETLLVFNDKLIPVHFERHDFTVTLRLVRDRSPALTGKFYRQQTRWQFQIADFHAGKDGIFRRRNSAFNDATKNPG